MKKTLVAYFSKTGSNEYLAKRIAQSLGCEIEPINPRFNFLPILFLLSFFRLSVAVKISRKKISEYDRIIVVGPIWGGQFIPPLRETIKKCKKENKEIFFVSCCGTPDDKKDDSYGYEHVFKKVKELGGENVVQCEAFPIPLVLTEEELKNDKLVMNTRLSDENFKGEIQKRFDNFIEKISSAVKTESVV